MERKSVMDEPLLWVDTDAQPVRRILVVDDDPDINYYYQL